MMAPGPGELQDQTLVCYPHKGKACPCRGSSGWPSARTTSSSLGLFLLTLNIFVLSSSAPLPPLAEPNLEGFITQTGHSINSCQGSRS